MSRAFCAALLGACLLAGAGCSLPRIVVHDDPLSPAEHLALGQAYEARGEAELAVREYRAAARSEPLARLYLGNALFGLGRLEEAEEAYRRAIHLLPDNPETYNNLAWLLYTQGRRLEEAEALAARAANLAPDRPEFRDTLDKVRAARASP